MTKHTIKPFYFPTTVTFVDDSSTFLSNLCLQLDPGLAFRLFSSPADALEFVNSRPRTGLSDEPIFAPFRDRTDEDDAHQVIALERRNGSQAGSQCSPVPRNVGGRYRLRHARHERP